MSDSQLYVAVEVHTQKPVMARVVEVPVSFLAKTLIARCLAEGVERRADTTGLMRTFDLRMDAGLIIVAENRSHSDVLDVMVDLSDSHNLVSSRGEANISRDVLPPLTRQVLVIMSQMNGAGSYSYRSQCNYSWTRAGTGAALAALEVHEPAIANPGVHVPVPMPLLS